jgi:hypothetical protein
VESTNSVGTVSYRRVLNRGLYGKYNNVSIRDSNFGKEVSIAVTDKLGIKNYINLLFDQKRTLQVMQNL